MVTEHPLIRRLPMIAALLLVTSRLAFAFAESSLEVDQDEDDSWEQPRYYAGANELLEVHYAPTTEGHVWGHGVVETGNAHDGDE